MKHDIKVGDVWKCRPKFGKLGFPLAEVLCVGDELIFCKMTPYSGDKYESTLPLDLFYDSYTIIERYGKPVINAPQGEDLVGMVCGFSDINHDDAEKNAEDLKIVGVVAIYDEYASYITNNNVKWIYAYPVDTSKLKQWSPDNE